MLKDILLIELKIFGMLLTLVPGTAFDRPQHARLGYCCNPKILQQGLEKLSEYLRKFD